MGEVWFITGAGRGMGVDIAKAALGAGHKVVATGRNTDKAAQAVGTSAGLLVVRLDVTKPTDAESAVNLITADRLSLRAFARRSRSEGIIAIGVLAVIA
jgi:NAD(P)-dependent dehydrogenase (short-subunit alcohol dehydrogenase family)